MVKKYSELEGGIEYKMKDYDEDLERLMEKKRYKYAYQRCIELIDRKEHVSYAKLTMRSLIDKIDAKERRKDIGKILLSLLLWILLIIVVLICKNEFHLDKVGTIILMVLALVVPAFVCYNWVRTRLRWYGYGGYGKLYVVPGIRLEFTPQITFEKICGLLKESLPDCTLQIRDNFIKITSAQNNVYGDIYLKQNEKRRFTTIVIDEQFCQFHNRVGKAFLSDLLYSLKDGIPNMIDDSYDQYIPKELLELRERKVELKKGKKKRIMIGCGVVCGIVVLAGIIAILATRIGSASRCWPNPDAQPLSDDLTFNVNGVQFVMKPVEGGTFRMGATTDHGMDRYYGERPVHKVTLNSFYMGETEVTQALWQAVMGTTVSQQRNKASSGTGLHGEGDNYPMYYVTWEECQEFISKLDSLTGKAFRLPTEAEWEYAARGGRMSKGCKFAGSNTISDLAWYNENSNDETHEVKTKQPNELGLYDMSGNVWEWCQDWYGDYIRGSQNSPQGPSSGSDRVLRGGSWDCSAGYSRVPFRNRSDPGSRGYDFGLRLCLPQ